MNRILRVVVLIVSCLVAVVLFFSSGISPSYNLPIRLPPAISYRWFDLTLTHPVLGVVLPLALVAFGLFVWLWKDGVGS